MTIQFWVSFEDSESDFMMFVLFLARDGIETPDETIVSIRLEVFWINYLSTYGLPSIFLNIYSSYLVPTYQILSNF